MRQPDFAQDPNELFDVVTYDGAPAGIVKSRAAVHRDGDWHRAIHVWVIGIDERGPFVIFQRRSLAKDTWPGRLDSTVGGHLRSGDGVEETLREVEEEIGITVALGDLRPVGRRYCVNDREAGVRDHEIQDVFFLRDDRPLDRYAPNPAELMGLVRCPLGPLLEFLAGNASTVPATSFDVADGSTHAVTLSRDDFILNPDGYAYRVAIAAGHVLAGERHVSI